MKAGRAPLVSIVLLNYNGRAFLASCLDSVLAQDYPLIEVIIVDNASTDGSLGILEEPRFAAFKLIKNEDNEGFARGMNIGMAAAAGEYIMPLNFDVVMEPRFISQMAVAADQGDKVGSVSGKLLRLGDAGKTNVIDSTGHVIFKNRYVINRGEDAPDTGQFDKPDFVFGTCGAIPLYKKTMLDDIAWQGQYYDESFFIMLEDVDIDWRAQLRGWRCAYTPAAVAYHYRGATGSGKSRLIQRHYYKNRHLLILKNDGALSYFLHIPVIWLMDLYLNIDILFTAPVALLLACSDIIRLLPLTLRKRRVIQATRVAPRSAIESWFKPYHWSLAIRRKLGLPIRGAS